MTYCQYWLVHLTVVDPDGRMHIHEHSATGDDHREAVDSVLSRIHLHEGWVARRVTATNERFVIRYEVEPTSSWQRGIKHEPTRTSFG